MPLDLVRTDTICDKHSEAQYECGICGMDVENDCLCIWDPEVVEIDVLCTAHDNFHRGIKVEDLVGHITNYEPEPVTLNTATTGTGSSWSSLPPIKKSPSLTYTSKCRHFNNPVEFQDGTKVYPSSKHDRDWDAPCPDFGLYLDSSWNPSCLAYLVDWPDMSIPYKWDKAAEAIIETFKKAKNGFWVEIGCIGGHGRTGTVLGCMAVLSGMRHDEAVKFIRSTYCKKAIESREQEWWIEWFDCYMNGGETSPQPVWSKSKWYAGEAYSYNEPFDWENWDPADDKQGAPPEAVVKTGREEYFTVRTYDDKGDSQTNYVDAGTPEFEELKLWYAEQEQQKKAKKEAEKAAEDAKKAASTPKKASPAKKATSTPKKTTTKAASKTSSSKSTKAKATA